MHNNIIMDTIMKFRVTFFNLFFAMLLLVSCSPDPGDLPYQPLPSNEDSTFIKTIEDIDNRSATKGDILNRLEFFYDSRKRIIKMEQFDSLNRKNGIREIFYNGQDTLPYKL